MDGRMDEKKELMNTKDTWTEGWVTWRTEGWMSMRTGERNDGETDTYIERNGENTGREAV
jgi:hypothetical protein